MEKILFLIESKDELRFKAGTTLALARAVKSLHYDPWFCNLSTIKSSNSHPSGETYQFESLQHDPLQKNRRTKSRERLDNVAFVFFRAKQTNFNREILQVCSLADVRFDNEPAAILRHSSKLSALQYDASPVSFVCRTAGQIKSTVKETSGDTWIIKSTDGFRGRGIHKISSEISEEAIGDKIQSHGHFTVVQPFLPVNETGDKRVLVINGKPVAWGLRFPGDDEFLANHHAGGYYEPSELTKREKTIAHQVGRDLQERDLNFAGLDFIDEQLIEINVGSIGSAVSINDFFPFNVPEKIIENLLEPV